MMSKKMCLDAENGVLKHMKPGSYLIDHTTSSPGLAVRIAEEATKKNIHSIDAPVSGVDIGAKKRMSCHYGWWRS